MMKKALLTLLAAALLPLAAVAQQNNYPQFSGDSILFVLVDFPTMQFQYSAAEIENSIADYACNGKRVVGPYHMTGMPSAYNGYSTSFLQFGLDVYDSAATDVDMSHFPFDSSHANMVIVYPGTIAAMSQQNTYFGQAGTLFEFSGEDKSLYYTFFS